MDDLTTWFKDRPRWLQEAANLLLTKGVLTDEVVDILLAKCLREANSEDSTVAVAFPTDAIYPQNASPLHLCSISNVKGINALAPRSPLDFGQSNLAIVYGSNGSGKSGYVRILKHVCGSRNPGALHPNVFAEDRPEQSASITYKSDNQEHHLCWNVRDGVHGDLRSVDIFDSECGRMYLVL